MRAQDRSGPAEGDLTSAKDDLVRCGRRSRPRDSRSRPRNSRSRPRDSLFDRCGALIADRNALFTGCQFKFAPHNGGIRYAPLIPRRMTFHDVLSSLPNGFRDTELLPFGMDYVRRHLAFHLVVWIGDMNRPDRREVYRPARLSLEGVAFLVIEPPDSTYPWLTLGPIGIDAGDGQPTQTSSAVPTAPSGSMYLAS